MASIKLQLLKAKSTDVRSPRLTLVERCLLSLQPDLHNVQRCDCKQIHTDSILLMTNDSITIKQL